MIKIAYNSNSDPPKLKRQTTHMKLLIIHHQTGSMISCFVNHLLSVSNSEGHITNNNLLDEMIAAPGIIGIYVNILSWYGDHSIYQCLRHRRRPSWAVESEFLTLFCTWSAIVGGGVECWLGGKNRFNNLTGIFLLCPTQNLRHFSKKSIGSYFPRGAATGDCVDLVQIQFRQSEHSFLFRKCRQCFQA